MPIQSTSTAIISFSLASRVWGALLASFQWSDWPSASDRRVAGSHLVVDPRGTAGARGAAARTRRPPQVQVSPTILPCDGSAHAARHDAPEGSGARSSPGGMSPRRRYRRAGTETQQCNLQCGCSWGRCLSPFATNLKQRDMSGVAAGSQFGGGWWPASSVRRRQSVNLDLWRFPGLLPASAQGGGNRRATIYLEVESFLSESAESVAYEE